MSMFGSTRNLCWCQSTTFQRIVEQCSDTERQKIELVVKPSAMRSLDTIKSHINNKDKMGKDLREFLL
ncbi:CLUMA_CG003590, isoform A [Clunio marinus]|uniref:CLUMA_CG003590, isoform A n=1 Tax=Clunio marinus TaxID=568069 RepID=A0A1J1HU92_9DIPT|nr:CLUMA_CG003590, isoform A [Clunio marinus]